MIQHQNTPQKGNPSSTSGGARAGTVDQQKVFTAGNRIQLLITNLAELLAAKKLRDDLAAAGRARRRRSAGHKVRGTVSERLKKALQASPRQLAWQSQAGV